MFCFFIFVICCTCNLPTVSYMYWGLTKPHNLKLCFWKDMVMTLRDMFILEMGIWMIKCCRPSLTVNMLMCNEDSLRVVLWSRVQRYKLVLQQYCKIVISCPGFLTNTNSEKRFYNLELLYWNPCKGRFPFGKKPSLDFPFKLIWVRNLILLLIMAEKFWQKKKHTNKNKELSAVAWSTFQRLTCKSVVWKTCTPPIFCNVTILLQIPWST